MHSPKSFEAQWIRLLAAAGAKTDTALARALGILPQSVTAARRRKKIPGGWVGKISEQFGVSADWLFFGVDAASEENIDSASGEAGGAAAYRGVPVIGLASCGLTGWYNPGPLAIRASLHYPAGGLFAVLAVGASMQPDGIRQGHVLFCDPSCEPEEGDAVFIKKIDGTASVKRFIGRDSSWIQLQGWLDPDASGAQKPYQERLAQDTVAAMACVVLVRRKA